MLTSSWGSAARLSTVILGCVASIAHSQSLTELAEVRQIVTFRFVPGRAGDAIRVFGDKLRPIYSGIPALLRFRGYREVESPEPLDLVVVSSYRGMEGMDRANESLRRPLPSGQSALSLYGTLSAMTQAHHDQFVEIIAPLSDTARGAGGLTVFDYLRLAPGPHAAFERLLAQRVRGFERERMVLEWSETGRMLLSDGWDYVRVFGVRSLADWHHYVSTMRGAAFHEELQGQIAARKTIIVREVPGVAVR